MNPKMTVIYKEPATILKDAFAEETLKEYDNVRYSEILLRTRLMGATKPLLLDITGKLVSDRADLKAMVEAGIKSVPTITVEDSDELKRLQKALGHTDDLMSKYKTLMHNMPRKDTAYAMLIRKEILEEVYGIKQGIRGDLNPELKAAITQRNNITSTAYRTMLNRIAEELFKVFKDDKDARNEWIRKYGTSISIKSLLREARKLVAKSVDANGEVQLPSVNTTLKQKTETKPIGVKADVQLPSESVASKKHEITTALPLQSESVASKKHEITTALPSDQNDKEECVKTYDASKINFFNQSCFELSLLPNNIDLIITSPPYWLFRAPQDGINNEEEIGIEPDVDTYAERLSDCFVRCKPKLKKNAIIYVVIADKVNDGCYQGAPELFMIKMIQKGFKLRDKYYWVKSVARPHDGDHSIQNVEHIFKFSLDAKPNTYYDWLATSNDYNNSTFGKGNTIKFGSYLNLSDHVIATAAANTAKLRDKCIEKGLYLEHSTTYPIEVPYACIRLSARKNSVVADIFSGCGNTAVACLQANIDADLNLSFYGTEINPESVKASKINIEEVYGFKPINNTVDFQPNYDNQEAA